jgi:hypothetical protein
MRAYPLTGDEYEALWLEQGGLCGLCERPNVAGRALAIDHDHTTGVVRGLLCNRCNMALGQLRDDPDLLERAAAYVRRGREAPPLR